jgi:hypothetical protein
VIILDTLKGDEAKRFQTDAEAGEKLADGEACWALKQMLSTTSGLPADKRAKVLHAMAAL